MPHATLIMCLGASLVLTACSEPETPTMTTPYPYTIELVGFDGCPNTPLLRENLREGLALGRWAADVAEVDLTSLDASDPRRGFAAPSVLIDGRDLFGSPPNASGNIGCRVYPGGVPTAEQLLERLRIEAAR
jgi:hypothetical protein